MGPIELGGKPVSLFLPPSGPLGGTVASVSPLPGSSPSQQRLSSSGVFQADVQSLSVLPQCPVLPPGHTVISLTIINTSGARTTEQMLCPPWELKGNWYREPVIKRWQAGGEDRNTDNVVRTDKVCKASLGMLE